MPAAPALIADTVNPVFVLLLAAAPFAAGRPAWPEAAGFWLRSALGIGLAVLLAEEGKRLQIWPGHPSFPSGHETFALASLTCLAARDRRWLAPGLPLAGLLAYALVAADYHRPADVAGALATGPLPALLCHRAGRGRGS